jgi:hypothetical protein
MGEVVAFVSLFLGGVVFGPQEVHAPSARHDSLRVGLAVK